MCAHHTLTFIYMHITPLQCVTLFTAHLSIYDLDLRSTAYMYLRTAQMIPVAWKKYVIMAASWWLQMPLRHKYILP